MHVKPAKYIRRGKLEDGRWDWICAGMKRLKFISHFVVEALCANLRSLPPKEVMEALVCRDIINHVPCISRSPLSVYKFRNTIRIRYVVTNMILTPLYRL